METKTKQRGSW